MMTMYATIEGGVLKMKGRECWMGVISEAVELCVSSDAIRHAVLRRREHYFARYGYFNTYWQLEDIEFSCMMSLSDLISVIGNKLCRIGVVLKMVSVDVFLNTKEILV